MNASTPVRVRPRGGPVTLRDGTRVTLRGVRQADAAPLLDLYTRLSDETRYSRFLSLHRVDAREAAGFAAAALPGAGVVAEAAPGVLVAHALVAPPERGTAEFGIVVDDAFQGHGLGRAVLDALAATARRRGVETLAADVLATNHRMLRLLASRGLAVVDRDDWSTWRVTVSTRRGMPAWPPWAGGRRVLVESAAWLRAEESALRRRGCAVVTCLGPGPGRRCPALAGDRCMLADGADAVLVALGHGGDDARRLVAAHTAAGRRVAWLPGSTDGAVHAPRGVALLPTAGAAERPAAVVRWCDRVEGGAGAGLADPALSSGRG